MSLRGYASIFVLLWSSLLPLTGRAQVSASLSGRVTDQSAVISGKTNMHELAQPKRSRMGICGYRAENRQ
jgi:hypothetical protein